MRAQTQVVHIVPLVVQPGLNQVVREHAAAHQELVVPFQRRQRLLQRPRHLPDARQLRRRHLVQVLVHRIRRLNLVDDAIQPRHQHRRERQVGVAGRVGRAEFQPPRRRAVGIRRNADARRAVPHRIDQVHRRLKPGHQPLVAVGRRRRKGQQRRRVQQQPADVVPAGGRQHRIPVGVVEQVAAVLPQALVAVHPRAVVAEQRLGHKSRHLAVGLGHILDHILEDGHRVRHPGQRVVAHVDFGLAGVGDFVVMLFHHDVKVLNLLHHLGADVLEGVEGRRREVALFEARAVGQVVGAVDRRGGPAVPDPLIGIDEVVAGVHVLVKPGGVKDEKLRLRPPETGVGQPAGLQVRLRFLRHIARIPGEPFPRYRIHDVAQQVQRRDLKERIHLRGVDVRHQQHIAFVNGLEPANAGTVKPVALRHVVRGELAQRDGQVLESARQVREPQVNDADAVFRTVVNDFLRGHFALFSL